MIIKPNNELEFHELICNFIDERNAKRKYVTDLDFIKTSINEKGYQLLYAPLWQRSKESWRCVRIHAMSSSRIHNSQNG